MKKNSIEFYGLLLLSFLIFIVNQDVIYVNIMEARNFITAREMLLSGDWIFTTLNDIPRYEKPPLPTWLTAIAASFFGFENLYGLRLPASLLGVLSILMTYKITLRLTENKSFSFLTGLIAVTSFYIVVSGRDAQWDIFTHGFMLVAIFYLLKLFNDSSNYYRNAFLAGLFLGFSFLSKGPVSLYGLFLPFIISYGIVFEFKLKKEKIVAIVLAVLVALVVSSSWNIYIYLFDTQNLASITQKEAENWINYNTRPFYYYWSFFIQSGLWTIPALISLFYPYLKNRVFNKKAYQFTLLWTLIGVFLLSIIPEKKPRYLLPVLFPLAINTAFYIEYVFRHFLLMKLKEKWPLYLHFGIIALVGIITPFGIYFYFGEKLNGYYLWFSLTSLFLFIVGVLTLKFLINKKIKKAFFASIVFIPIIICFALPLSKIVNPNPDYRSARIIEDYKNSLEIPAYVLFSFEPEFIWEAKQILPPLFYKGDEQMPKEDEFLVVIEKNKELEDKARQLLSDFNFQKIDSLNINPTGRQRERFIKNIYHLKKQ